MKNLIKRAFDIAFSAASLLVLAPVLVPVAVILRLTGEGKVLYAQERLGRGGRTFRMLKFATMLENSPNLPGGDITVAYDPRVLPVGRFLRKTKINELPQLINILLGDMSVIGPRPLTPRVAAYCPQSFWEEIAELRPGLSGVGSIVFRDEEVLLRGATDREVVYRRLIAPYKMALERWYLGHLGFVTDMKLILLTVLVVVFRRFPYQRWLEDLPPPPPEMQQSGA